MLGPIDLTGNGGLGVDWVIVGGETGPKARPMHPNWVRCIRDQCQAAGVQFFFKQWGEWIDDNQDGFMTEFYPQKTKWWNWGDASSSRIGKKLGGRLLDGREWNEVARC
jgi:protein gp37